MNNLIQTIAVYALPLLFSITLHEAAHGYVARIFGDSTAYLLGRVSLNPLRHIDPIGTIAIPLLMNFATGGAFLFGYAKPVPVAFHKLRNPRWHSVGRACRARMQFPASSAMGALGHCAACGWNH